MLVPESDIRIWGWILTRLWVWGWVIWVNHLLVLVSVMRLRWDEELVMLVWMLLRLVLVEVRKPRRSFLHANAVDRANPIVIAFPVVHNKPTRRYPLKCPKWTLTTGRTANASHRRRKQDANFTCTVPGCGSTSTRGSEEQKQPMILKRRQTGVNGAVRIFGLSGPYDRCQITLLPSLMMPPFSDLSSSHLLIFMLARYSSSHQTFRAFNLIFSSVASHRIVIAFQLATTRKKRLYLFIPFLLFFPVTSSSY